MTEEDEIKEKHDLLPQIYDLEKQGFQFYKHYTIDDDLDEIKFEYQKMLQRRQKQETKHLINKCLFYFARGWQELDKRTNIETEKQTI